MKPRAPLPTGEAICPAAAPIAAAKSGAGGGVVAAISPALALALRLYSKSVSLSRSSGPGEAAMGERTKARRPCMLMGPVALNAVETPK